MKSTKYVLLTLVAIAFWGLIWLFNSSPVVSQPKVQLQTEPPLEQVIPDETIVKLEFQALDTDEQPLKDANVRVRILTPAKNPWFTSDFPIVEGTELLNLDAIAPQGNLKFEQVFPIRGKYRIEVRVNPQVKGAFKAFEQSFTLNVPENAVKYRNLAVLAAILLGVGFGSGWILGGDQTVRENEIAPQPVRMLLSGITIVAIAVLFLVNWSAEIAAHHSEGDAVTFSTPSATIENEAVQVELLGDTQTVVGNLATKTVQVTNPTTGKPRADVQVSVQSVALENNALMFAYQGTPDTTGKLTWQEQFFDGAPHSVIAEVTPLENSSGQFTPLKISQEIEVKAIAPPLLRRLISLLYFTLIFVVGLIAGLGGRRRQKVTVS
jgi:hypothetical protein